MYRLATFGLILTAAALLCWPAPVLAGPTVPYKDKASGWAMLTPTDSRTTFLADIWGEGEATHLGLYEFTGHHTLQFNTPTTGEIRDGTFTFTAADGSTISGTYSGTFAPSPTDPDVRQNVLDVVVTGGTGRLSGVTGSITTTVDVVGAPPMLTFTWTSVGEIDLGRTP
jgi:hypothetical protein